MRTTLNIDNDLVEKAGELTGIKEKLHETVQGSWQFSNEKALDA